MTLSLAWLFTKISKIIKSDDELLKFYGVKNNQKWNDKYAMDKKKQVINMLRTLACQQQELLKYKETKIEDITFDAVKHMDILNDFPMLTMYINSRILFNTRELLPKVSKPIDFQCALKYIDCCNSSVMAITSDISKCKIEILPAMEKKDFWENRSSIVVNNITYYPTIIGTNVKLACDLLAKGNIIICF